MNSAGRTALPQERCRSLLKQGQAGRVAFTSKALPNVVPVRYRIEGDELVLEAVVGSEWPARVAGAVVAFEVDRFGSDHEVDWSVVVIGQAERDRHDGASISMDLTVALLSGESRGVTAGLKS